jgi:hypothetical protein
MVKLEDPPSIGFLNGALLDGLRQIEECRAQHGIPPPELRARSNVLFPEDWLSVILATKFIPPEKSRLVYETASTEYTFNPT